MTAYATVETKSKKELKDKVIAGEKIGVIELTPFGQKNIVGKICISGPRYPKPHTWYAEVETDEEGYIKKIK